MKTEFVVREVFRLSTGTTVLACEGGSDRKITSGSQATLICGEEVRQALSILGEQRMLNPSVPRPHRALETNDAVALSTEEARSGAWRLVIQDR